MRFLFPNRGFGPIILLLDCFIHTLERQTQCIFTQCGMEEEYAGDYPQGFYQPRMKVAQAHYIVYLPPIPKDYGASLTVRDQQPTAVGGSHSVSEQHVLSQPPGLAPSAYYGGPPPPLNISPLSSPPTNNTRVGPFNCRRDECLRQLLWEPTRVSQFCSDLRGIDYDELTVFPLDIFTPEVTLLAEVTTSSSSSGRSATVTPSLNGHSPAEDVESAITSCNGRSPAEDVENATISVTSASNGHYPTADEESTSNSSSSRSMIITLRYCRRSRRFSTFSPSFSTHSTAASITTNSRYGPQPTTIFRQGTMSPAENRHRLPPTPEEIRLASERSVRNRANAIFHGGVLKDEDVTVHYIANLAVSIHYRNQPSSASDGELPESNPAAASTPASAAGQASSPTTASGAAARGPHNRSLPAPPTPVPTAYISPSLYPGAVTFTLCTSEHVEVNSTLSRMLS